MLARFVSLALPLSLSIAACGGAPPDDSGSSSSAITHCVPHNVVRRDSSSWLIDRPRVTLVYLGSYWNGAEGWDLKTSMDGFWSTTSNDPAFWNRIGEYGVTGGSFGGSIVVPTPLTDNPAGDIVWSPDDMSHIVKAFVDARVLQRIDQEDLFIINVPPNVSVQSGGDAYHSSITDSEGNKVWYVEQQYWNKSNFDLRNIETSHEIYEAASDPDGHNGYRDTVASSHPEIGDICDHIGVAWGGSMVQEVWSQLACTCVGAKRPPIVDPCMLQPPAQRLCCHKPWLPVCSE
jgi:hypothetical protein